MQAFELEKNYFYFFTIDKNHKQIFHNKNNSQNTINK